MSYGHERILTNTRKGSFGEAIDLFIEANYQPEKNSFQPFHQGSIKFSFDDQVDEATIVRSDLVIGVDYKLGYYRLASTQTELTVDDRRRRLMESQEFIFFQDQDRDGLIQLIVTDHQSGLPVCANYTLEAIQEECPNAYQQYRFALLILLSVVATSCYNRDIFNPFVAKVKRLVSETIEKESLDEFWKIATRIKNEIQVKDKQDDVKN